MKSLEFFLFFAIIGYCFTDTEIVDCQSEFEIKVKEKCEAIGSCTYNSKDEKCIETHECSDGDRKTQNECEKIVPKNFNFYKCKQSGSGSSSKCELKPKECEDFNLIGNRVAITGDICFKLSGPTTGKHCVYQNIPGSICKDFYEQCSSITKTTHPTDHSSVCENNIPKDPSKKCEWNTEDNSNPYCNTIARPCSSSERFYNESIDTCALLTASVNTKKCIYKAGVCQEEFIRCEDHSFSSDQCDNYYPLNQNNDGYDYTMKCALDESRSDPENSEYKCKTVKNKCTEFENPNDSILKDLESQGIKFDKTFCNKLEVSKDYYRCAYDKSGKCYQEYKTCEDYTNNKIETDRKCEDIILLTSNQKCFYENKNDTCYTREIFQSCGEYKGADKKTCESILSPENKQYCILDKDSECIEKPINCTEAHDDKDKCLKITKASDSNKRCAYKNGKCVEEYIRCEDFLASSTSTYLTNQNNCEDIRLYDGKKCNWISTNTNTGTNICVSQFKTCEDATTKEECKLIAKTGVDDPERKVCDWYPTNSPPCIDNYKYCSDYRGTDYSICNKIKPYDETGENIAVGFKCYYEPNVGCQRVPVECKDAGNNPFLCESYSQYIKDKDKKHCVFDGIDDDDNQSCRAHYKKCEYFESGFDISCSDNIIEGYIRGVCDDSSGKCEQKKDCNLFSKLSSSKSIPTHSTPNPKGFYYKELCEKISYNCTYSINDATCTNKVKKCEEITFYTNDINNKDICERIELKWPYEKCVLREDLSGCEVVYKEFDFSTANNSYSTPPDSSSQGNSSGFIVKGIHLIIALLCFLI